MGLVGLLQICPDLLAVSIINDLSTVSRIYPYFFVV